MIDLHCHLDLYPNPHEVVRECSLRHMYVLCVTTTPSAWQGTTALSKDTTRIKTALGLHPQLAGQRKHELPLFDEYLPNAKYVGEVGLDGGDEFKATWEDQVRVFTHVLQRCTEACGRIISIHSRRATPKVLDQLEKYPACGVPILHWFSGTLGELNRAIRMGCWFSVGPAMLSSKKGREIAAHLPRERVLTETDGPFAQCLGRTLQPWDVGLAVTSLSDVWEMPEADANELLDRNLRSLVTT